MCSSDLVRRKKSRPFQPDFHDLERRMLPTTFMVLNPSDSGVGSLRQAILGSNAAPGSNVIDFSIGTGPQTISLLSALPTITVPVTIDGTSQPGYAGAPLIDVDGGSAGPGVSGLVFDIGSDGSARHRHPNLQNLFPVMPWPVFAMHAAQHLIAPGLHRHMGVLRNARRRCDQLN